MAMQLDGSLKHVSLQYEVPVEVRAADTETLLPTSDRKWYVSCVHYRAVENPVDREPQIAVA